MCVKLQVFRKPKPLLRGVSRCEADDEPTSRQTLMENPPEPRQYDIRKGNLARIVH